VTCQIASQVPGITYDGGYAEYMIAPAGALALIPEELSAVDAGPLMCAGITTFNPLRNSGARPGETVAVLGVGGLGHLGIQFAAKMGFKTVAIARGKDKEPLARKLGAWQYIDSQVQDAAAELAELGGARVILATVTSGKAMSAVLGGLGVNGKLIVLGAAAEALEVTASLLIAGRRSIMGWPSGTSIDSQDTLAFSVLTGVRPMTLERRPAAARPAGEHRYPARAVPQLRQQPAAVSEVAGLLPRAPAADACGLGKERSDLPRCRR
jgi:D-arabinose 1-dehydrogenase-like Zn-dependent alcohol dehydrogenase